MSEEKCRFINKNDKISCDNCHIGGFCDEVEINECDYKQLKACKEAIRKLSTEQVDIACIRLANHDLRQQLQTAKEENERLRNLLGKPYKRRIDLENNKLTQQNKQMREAIEMGMDVLQNNNKNTVQSEDFRDKLDGLWVIFNQALKGVE